MPQQTERPHLLKLGEAAALLATSERHVRSLVFRREVPYFKVGPLLRFDERDLIGWLEGRKVAAERGNLAS